MLNKYLLYDYGRAGGWHQPDKLIMVRDGKGLPSHCHFHAYLVQSALQTWSVLVLASNPVRSLRFNPFSPITTQAPNSGVKAQASKEVRVRRFSCPGLWPANSGSVTDPGAALYPQRCHRDTRPRASRWATGAMSPPNAAGTSLKPTLAQMVRTTGHTPVSFAYPRPHPV